jgi:phytoene dehydrogenase-like protein
MLAAAETVLPGLRDAAHLIMPGTPVTFRQFTRRAWGWVGGFPQTSLFRAWGPRLAPNLWLVGDSIFPGQSTAAVALGGLRVARTILAEAGVKVKQMEEGRSARMHPDQASL